MRDEAMIEAAIACGAAKAQVIPLSQVATSAEFRKVCQSNGCGNYGRCWMCPPSVGDIEDLMARLHAYDQGLLYQTIARIEDSFDIEGMLRAGDEHAQVSQRIQAALASRLAGPCLHLTCGGCRLCEVCAKRDDQPCRHPDRALPSLESYGVDVYQTVKNTQLRYVNGLNTVTYFGMLLFWRQRCTN